MITGGIDVGIEYTKAVVLKDGQVIGQAQGCSGGAGRADAIEAVWNEALNAAGADAANVQKVVATGKGKFQAAFVNEKVTEPVVYAKAARTLYPKATMIADIGADETLVVTINKNGNVKESCINQKCAAGLGIFLERMADRLEMSMEDMGQLQEEHTEAVHDACVMFAELDALSLLNRDVPPKHVAMAVTEAAAVRANTTLNDITIPDKEVFVLTGGLAENPAFVKALKKLSGIEFLIPKEAVYAGAIGAALIAAE